MVLQAFIFLRKLGDGSRNGLVPPLECVESIDQRLPSNRNVY